MNDWDPAHYGQYADERSRPYGDLIRRIGQPAYEARVAALIERYGGGRFAAELAVHGQAVRAGEITR